IELFKKSLCFKNRHCRCLDDIFSVNTHKKCFLAETCALTFWTWVVCEKIFSSETVAFCTSAIWRVEGEKTRFDFGICKAIVWTHELYGHEFLLFAAFIFYIAFFGRQFNFNKPARFLYGLFKRLRKPLAGILHFCVVLIFCVNNKFTQVDFIDKN